MVPELWRALLVVTLLEYKRLLRSPILTIALLAFSGVALYIAVLPRATEPLLVLLRICNYIAICFVGAVFAADRTVKDVGLRQLFTERGVHREVAVAAVLGGPVLWQALAVPSLLATWVKYPTAVPELALQWSLVFGIGLAAATLSQLVTQVASSRRWERVGMWLPSSVLIVSLLMFFSLGFSWALGVEGLRRQLLLGNIYSWLFALVAGTAVCRVSCARTRRRHRGRLKES